MQGRGRGYRHEPIQLLEGHRIEINATIPYSRVKSLNSAGKHLRRMGNCRYIFNRKARLSDHLGSASRSKQADIVLDETLGKIKQPCLVIDRDNCFYTLTREFTIAPYRWWLRTCLLVGSHIVVRLSSVQILLARTLE